MEINNVRIDWLAQEILALLAEKDTGESNTAEMRERTGIDKGQRIKHRFKRLQEAGLVEVHQPDPDPDTNQFPPKEVRITEEGRYVVEEEGLERGKSGQVQDLRGQVERLEQELRREREQRQQMQEVVVHMGRLMGVNDDSILPDLLKMRAGFLGMDGYLTDAGVNVNEQMPDGTMDAVEEARGDVQEMQEQLQALEEHTGTDSEGDG